MFSFSRAYCSRFFDAVEPVCEVGIDVYCLGSGMGWKIVFELAESTEDCCVASLLVNRYPNSFFSASWAREDGW